MTAPAIFEASLQERQAVAVRLLTSALAAKSLSNGYLLTGRAVADKWLIAKQLAAFLNCLTRKSEELFSCVSNPSSSNGGQLCQNCQWISEGEHPQAWLVLAGEGASGKIPVEKARLLTDELNKTSRYMRVVVIPQAEQEYLHAAPANALLKSIEEPHENALFLMFASASEQVLPTIVSRSQMIPVLSRFKPGLWITPEIETGSTFASTTARKSGASASGDSDSAEAAGKNEANIESLKSEFIHSARKHLSGTSSQHGTFLKAVGESQDLAERMVSLTAEEAHDPELLLDIFLASELEVLREFAKRDAAISLYLSKLATLVESSKSQLNHYVKPSNVLETFAYSLTELRSKCLGDFCLAKC